MRGSPLAPEHRNSGGILTLRAGSRSALVPTRPGGPPLARLARAELPGPGAAAGAGQPPVRPPPAGSRL